MLVLAPTRAHATPTRAAPYERFSLPQGSVDDAWASPGFRLGLGFGVGGLWGSARSAGGTLIGGTIRAAWRFGPRLSLASTFFYGALSGDLDAMRYAITVEPTWHPERGLSLGLGVGYGGLIGDVSESLRENEPGFGSVSRGEEPTISHCEAGGIVGVARISYLFRLGRVGSTGPQATGIVQWTRCTDTAGDDREIVQWWTHLGFSLAWTFSWR